HPGGVLGSRKVAGAAQRDCTARQPGRLPFQPAAAPYAQYYLDVFKTAAPSLGIAAIAAPINKTSEIEPVIAEQARDQNGGLILMPDPFLLVHRAEITSLARPLCCPCRLSVQ